MLRLRSRKEGSSRSAAYANSSHVPSITFPPCCAMISCILRCRIASSSGSSPCKYSQRFLLDPARVYNTARAFTYHGVKCKSGQSASALQRLERSRFRNKGKYASHLRTTSLAPKLLQTWTECAIHLSGTNQSVLMREVFCCLQIAATSTIAVVTAIYTVCNSRQTTQYCSLTVLPLVRDAMQLLFTTTYEIKTLLRTSKMGQAYTLQLQACAVLTSAIIAHCYTSTEISAASSQPDHLSSVAVLEYINKALVMHWMLHVHSLQGCIPLPLHCAKCACRHSGFTCCATLFRFRLSICLFNRLARRLLFKAKVHQCLGLLPRRAIVCVSPNLLSLFVPTAKSVAIFIKAQRFQQALECLS